MEFYDRFKLILHPIAAANSMSNQFNTLSGALMFYGSSPNNFALSFY